MPVTRPDINYSGVPTVQAGGGGGDTSNVRATPESFGSGIGGAVEQAGQTGLEVAQKKQGIINETQANNAEVDFIKQSGDIKNKYMQYEGIEADKMRPQFEADLLSAHQQIRGSLNPAVQRAFDTTTGHQIALQTNEYSQYAATQLKSANLQSFDAVGNTAVATAGNLGAVLDPAQSKAALDTITYTGNQIAGIHGDASLSTGTDDKGNLTFPNTPEGQAAQARSLSYVNAKKADWYLTGAKTIADNMGTQKAADWTQSHWDEMPDIAKVKLNAYLAPKMVNEDIDGAIATASSNMAAATDHQIISNVPASPTAPTPATGNQPLAIRNNNPGNLRDPSTGKFRVFDTPEAGTVAMQADLTAKISGKSPAMEANFGKQYSPTLSNIITTYAPKNENNTKAYIDTVSKDTGFAPDQVLTVNDIPKLQVAMTKVEVGGSGKNIAAPQTQSQSQPQQQYSNDYERLLAGRQSFVDSAVNAITEKRGSDLGLIATTQKRAEANIDAQIRVAKGALDADQKNVQGAIDGSLTKGQVPMTLEQLRAAPNMAPLLDKVQREQPEFYNSILTRIAKAQHTDATQNSPNAYDAIQATLDTSKPYGRQERIEYLSKGLGSENPGYSISQKDYNDAKPAVDLKDGQKILSDHMQEIATAVESTAVAIGAV